MAGKNIVICSDGTGNTAVKNRGSNVFKLFEAIDLNRGRDRPFSTEGSVDDGATALVPHVTFYDDGVGTSSIRFLRVLGGALGMGLKRNVKVLYADLCRIYEPGDRIFLFGFSRGAFTVRTLAGLIADCGILNPDELAIREKVEPRSESQAPEIDRPCPRSDGRVRPWWERFVESLPWIDRRDPERQLRVAVGDAYETHRRNYASLLSRMVEAFFAMAEPPICPECGRRRFYCRYYSALKTESVQEGQASVIAKIEAGGKDKSSARQFGVTSRLPRRGIITFIGVWDTVDAVGVPFDWLAAFINRVIYRYTFPDLDAPKAVTRACHALAIDDERQTFHPLLWDESGTKHRAGDGFQVRDDVRDEGEDESKEKRESKVDASQKAISEHGLEAAAYASVVPEDDALNDGVLQVWFPGVHSNVGGGYVKQGMSLVALDWMMKHAEEYGLEFIPGVRTQYRALRNEYDMLYDSRAGLAVYYRFLPRDIDWLCEGPPERAPWRMRDPRIIYHWLFGRVRPRVSPIRIHVSTFYRIAQGTGAYSPGNLPVDFEIDGLPTHSVESVTEEIWSAYKRRLEEWPGRSLMRTRRRAIAIRRGAYYLFLTGSIITLLYSLPLDVSQHFPSTRAVTGISEIWAFIAGWIEGIPYAIRAIPTADVDESLFNMFIAVLKAWRREPFVFFVMIVAVIAALSARAARASALREFWAPLRKEMWKSLSKA